MRQTIQYFTAAILLLVVAFHALTPDAQAISPQEDGSSMRHLSMVLLGDSYSAGNGAGGYDFWHSEFRTKKDLSYRSDANWANHYRRRLLQEGISAPLTNHAHSGFKTSDVLGDPIKSIPADVDIIMLTIGGNDIGFGDVVSQCFALGLRDPLGCRDAITKARTIIGDPTEDGLAFKTKEVFDAIEDQLTALGRRNVQIVLVGYPNLLLPDSADTYDLHGCIDTEPGEPCFKYGTYPAGKEILETAREMTQVQKRAAWKWSLAHPSISRPAASVRYVSSIPERFRWHEPDAHASAKNPQRWINEFFETSYIVKETGKEEIASSGDRMEWYHPNVTGHQVIGDALMEEIGIPEPATPASSSGTAPNSEEPRVEAWLQPTPGAKIGEPLELDGAGSYTNRGGIVSYEWDLNNDGTYDQTTTQPMLTNVWDQEYVGQVALRITTDSGMTATATTEVGVTNDGDNTPYDLDNCPDVYNYGQTDYDQDGIGDECDDTPGHPTEDKPGVGEGPAPTPEPTPAPSPTPSKSYDPLPTAPPTPTQKPTPEPSQTPSEEPSLEPSETPSPTKEPTSGPSHTPLPTAEPSGTPSSPQGPTTEPTTAPSGTLPSTTALPTGQPSQSPTLAPPSASLTPSQRLSPTPIPSPLPPPTLPPPPTASPSIPSTSTPTQPPSPTPTPTNRPPTPTGAPAPPTPTGTPAPPDPAKPRPGLPNTGH